MPDELPTGWVKAPLGEVCARVATIQPEDSPDTKFTYFDIGGIDNKSNRIVETKTITGRDAPSRARQSVQKDDILFSNVRTYLKKIARIERDYPNPVASTGFTVIRAAEDVSSRFLFFQLTATLWTYRSTALNTQVRQKPAGIISLVPAAASRSSFAAVPPRRKIRPCCLSAFRRTLPN